MTQQDTKITTLVAATSEQCDGCCFRPAEDNKDDWFLCNFVKCLPVEREDVTSVIFMIGH